MNIKFFETETCKQHGNPIKDAVLVDSLPAGYIGWGYYTDARGYGYYEIGLGHDAEGNDLYVAIDNCEERVRESAVCEVTRRNWVLHSLEVRKQSAAYFFSHTK